MSGFDPDSYIAQKAPPPVDTAIAKPDPVQVQNFDPDQYLDQKGSTPDADSGMQEKYGGLGQMATTGVEQALSGLTLGASKVAETHLLGVKPEDIKGREEANPLTSFGANLVGGVGGAVGLAAMTGGASLLPEGAGLAAKIGVGAGIGSLIGGANQVTDDWSQNKALDAQKIAASAGIGSLFGGLGAAAAEGVSSLANKFSPVAKVAPGLAAEAESAGASSPETLGSISSDGSVGDAPQPPKGVKGVQPTNMDEMADRVDAAKMNGTFKELPQKAVLMDALSREPMENPVNPAQVDSLTNQSTRSLYSARKEMGDALADTLNGHEGLQKAELTAKTEDAIKSLHPESAPTADAVKGGQSVMDAFEDNYHSEKADLGPGFEDIKDVPINGNIKTDTIKSMISAVPKVANMLKVGEDNSIRVRPYLTGMGIDKSTYTAVAQAVKSLENAPNTLDYLRDIRSGLDQNIDVTAQGKGPSQIRALKAALMEQMQDSTGDDGIRELFKRNAVNEAKRLVIEKNFGASVGDKEFGQISRVHPKDILGKIFKDPESVVAAKNILNPDQFKSALSNWLEQNRALQVKDGAFSSNKWTNFLNKNDYTLREAFTEHPDVLQGLKDKATIMRILPDAPSSNPSGSAKTMLQMLKNSNMHNMSWEGMLSTIPKAALSRVHDHFEMQAMNKALAGNAANNSASNSLQNAAAQTSEAIGRKVREVFRPGLAKSVGQAASGQSRKITK